jgi:hypothetical protein
VRGRGLKGRGLKGRGDGAGGTWEDTERKLWGCCAALIASTATCIRMCVCGCVCVCVCARAYEAT